MNCSLFTSCSPFLLCSYLLVIIPSNKNKTDRGIETWICHIIILNTPKWDTTIPVFPKLSAYEIDSANIINTFTKSYDNVETSCYIYEMLLTLLMRHYLQAHDTLRTVENNYICSIIMSWSFLAQYSRNRVKYHNSDPWWPRVLTAARTRGSERAPWGWSDWAPPECERTGSYPWTSHCRNH